MRAIAYLPLHGLLSAGLALPALADTLPPVRSQPFPHYTVGPQKGGAIVMPPNQTITPAGKLVDLGVPTRGKAVAVNPNARTNTAAVLQMGAAASVQVFDLTTGAVLQSFTPATGNDGSFTGIAYSPDGSKLLFSQDYASALAIANVDPNTGLLSEGAEVTLPPDDTIPLYTPSTAYPAGVAASADNTTAYVLLNQNNTLGVVDLTQSPPKLTQQIRVGNVPDQIVLAGHIAYVSNEGGRVARDGDYTDPSSGTPIVSNPQTDSAKTGTVSVVYLPTGKVVKSIRVGLHPVGMALSGNTLYVANAYSETVSVIDTDTNKVTREIRVGVPLRQGAAFGAEPVSIAVDGTTLYVALYTANAIAVVDTTRDDKDAVVGYIPTASTPSTVALAKHGRKLVVSSDHGIGTWTETQTIYNVTALNSHPDAGRAEIIPVPSSPQQLANYTQQVYANNHWDLAVNTEVGPQYVNPNAPPVAIPAHIGEPSLIKHVFLIIKENRTYDQLFGDVATSWADPSLAVFGPYTPNQHALLQRFALLDNVYAPSRQSADGHPWIVSAISAYADDIQSPDWVRSYPGGNANDEMVYTPRGFIWEIAQKAGLSTALYGEWSTTQTIQGNYSWTDWYNYALYLEGQTKQNNSPINSPDVLTEFSNVNSAEKVLDPHYPSFNTGIPDQYRVDYWLPIFQQQEATNTLPALTVMWLPDDHTSGYSKGYPVPNAAQADNDLALGRIVEAVSHSKDWPTTAIFVEEDDAQNGVDHIDGHRQPVQVISPYAVQSNGAPDHTTYTQPSMDRTIEQILGLIPMTQFDLVASPMRTAFTNTPNLTPFVHLPPTIALDTFPNGNESRNTIRGAWQHASAEMFRGKINKADSVDENLLNHVTWYAATNFKRPYPGESRVLWPSEVKPAAKDD